MLRKKQLPNDELATCALRLLARREHAVLELKAKLVNRGYEQAAVETLLGKLVADNLLSDQRYAAMILNERLAQGYGPERVHADLSRWNVSLTDTEISEANWIDALIHLWQKRFGAVVAADFKARNKQIAYCLRRGFKWEQVKIAVERLTP